MRRLMLVLGAIAIGVAVYRQRSLDRREQELAIGPYADDQPV